MTSLAMVGEKDKKYFLIEANNGLSLDEQGGIIDSLMAGVGDVVLDTDDIDYETEHDSRKRQIAMQDPVHTIVLKDYVQSQVNSMALQLGESNYKEIINNVDVETRDNLMEYVSL